MEGLLSTGPTQSSFKARTKYLDCDANSSSNEDFLSFSFSFSLLLLLLFVHVKRLSVFFMFFVLFYLL